MNFEKTPYTTREGAIEWLMAHVDMLEDIYYAEYIGAGYEEGGGFITRARAVDIMESLLKEKVT